MRHDTQICILAVPDFRASLLENRVGARTGEMGRGGYIISKRTSKISKYRYIIGGGIYCCQWGIGRAMCNIRREDGCCTSLNSSILYLDVRVTTFPHITASKSRWYQRVRGANQPDQYTKQYVVTLTLTPTKLSADDSRVSFITNPAPDRRSSTWPSQMKAHVSSPIYLPSLCRGLSLTATMLPY